MLIQLAFIFSITKEPFYHYRALFSFQMTYQFTIFFTFVGLCSIKILLHLFSNKPKGHHHVVKLLPEVLHKPDPLQLFAVSAVHHVEEPGPLWRHDKIGLNNHQSISIFLFLDFIRDIFNFFDNGSGFYHYM